jgi:hypothetical protein
MALSLHSSVIKSSFFSNDKTSHMTITYFLRDVGVLPVFSEKLAHVVPIEDRSNWLLMALYKNWQVVTELLRIHIYKTSLYVYLKFTG